MMKMLIELDRDKILREQEYNLTEMEDCIERLFTDVGMHRDADGFFVDGDFISIGAIVWSLSDTQWFIENVKRWLWYESENEHPTDDSEFSIEDLVAHYCHRPQMVG